MFLVVPVSQPGSHVLPGLLVPLVLQELLVRVGRHLRRVVTTGKLLVVMVDAEFGVELEEVQTLLPVPCQSTPQGSPAAIEAHEMRLVRNRPVPVVAVRHVLVELAHGASELFLQTHNILLNQYVATPCFGLANTFTHR